MGLLCRRFAPSHSHMHSFLVRLRTPVQILEYAVTVISAVPYRELTTLVMLLQERSDEVRASERGAEPGLTTRAIGPEPLICICLLGCYVCQAEPSNHFFSLTASRAAVQLILRDDIVRHSAG